MGTQDSMLTTEDVANYLKVDVVTVRRLVSRGELAAYRVGAEFRFTLSDLQDYLKRQYVPVGGPAQARQQMEQRYGPYFPYFLMRQIFATAGKGHSRAKSANGERFTDQAKSALEISQATAEEQRCAHIFGPHLLLGLAKVSGGLASLALNEVGITVERIQKVLADEPQLTGPAREAADVLGIDPEVKHALESSVQQANKLGHNYIGAEHLLLGLLSEPKSKAVAVIKQLSVKPDALRLKVLELIKASGN